MIEQTEIERTETESTTATAKKDLAGTVAIVTGASRGFGRSIARTLAGAGAHVVGVGRDREQLAIVREELGEGFEPVVGDVTDAVLPARLLDEYRPGLLVLNAGAAPLMRPLQQQSWESFSRNWETDVRQAFAWSREALNAPIGEGSTVIAVSSGAALAGSPISGGYAGAKATVRFIAAYAAQESERGKLGIRFLSILPDLTARTDLGREAVAGYARRQGVEVEQFLKTRGEALDPDQVGAAILTLAVAGAPNGAAYSITAKGLEQLS
jgi:NAD(P)-dependent dehydrogenase (short-subunit alcohol dehydrogenase family)